MRNTERRPRSIGEVGIRLILFSLAALLLMALQLSGNLRPLQDAITQLTSPAQLSATGLTDSAAGFLRTLLTLRTLQQDAAALAVRNLQLEAQIESLREVETENEQLRAMLNFAQVRPRLELRGAQIVARKIGEESTNFLDTILIDLGRQHGIEVGMPVVTDQGLVGRISEVTDSVSKVLLLTDPSSSASALLADSRLNGVVRGSSSGDLVMDFIPQGPTFEVGEMVLSSGLGGKFPKGIAIGAIESIESQPNAVFQKAVVRPAVDFGSLETVMVITNFEPNESLQDLLVQPLPGATPAAEQPAPGEQPAEGAQQEANP
jgi:rod shape-determining protein MreC